MPFLKPLPIETDRFIVRLVEAADLPALMRVNGDSEVTRFLPYEAWQTLADAEAWYERMNNLQLGGQTLQFVIVAKQTAVAIGTCLIFRLEEESARAELGYVLGRSYWGSGAMQEVLRALIRCAFRDLWLRRLEAEVDPRNIASHKLLINLGFTQEGLLRQRWFTKGEPTDVNIYGLLRDEWFSRCSGT